MKRLAVDPPHCGCTECITGVYVPLDEALPKEIARMVRGRIADNTSCDVTIKFNYIWGRTSVQPRMEVLVCIDEYEFDVTKWGPKVAKGVIENYYC